MLGAQTEGMIGYMLEQELGNELPFERHLATLLTMIEVDAADPAFERPDQADRPALRRGEAARLEREKGWAFMADGDSMRRAVPSPAPKRIFGIHVIRTLLEQGVDRDLRRRRRHPHRPTRDEPAPAGRRLRGVEAVIDKDLASALLAIEIGADALLIVTDVDAVYADWGTPEQRAIRSATPEELAGSRVRRGLDGAEGPRRVLVRRAAPAASPRSARSPTPRRCCAARPAPASPSRPPSTRAERDRDGHHRTARDRRRRTEAPTWHVRSSREARRSELHVEPEQGLTSEEAAERLARYGPNRSPRRRRSRAGTRSCASTRTRCRSCCWSPA